MATIVQKEILIDRVVDVLGFISRQSNEIKEEMQPIRNEMKELRQYLYSTDHNEVDYEKLSERFDLIKNKYGMYIYE